MPDGDVSWDVIARDRASDAFDKAGKSADGLGGKLKGLGGVAAGAFSAGAVVGFGKAMFDNGVQLEAWNSKAKIVFGEQLASVKAWAKESANAMGLTSAEAVNLAGNVQDLLVPMGFARDRASQISTQLIGLAGALSLWSGGSKSAQEVSETLTAALLGERDALQSLGISISAEEIAARLAAEGKAELTGQAMQQAEAMTTLTLIMEKSTDAQNAFNDSEKTTQERLVETNARIGELSDLISTKFLGSLNSYATWAMNDGESITGFWKEYNERVDSAWDATARFFNGLADLKDKGNKWFTESLPGALGDFFGGLSPGDVAETFTVPGFHNGGVFRASTLGGEGLALLRDREVVLTPEQATTSGGFSIGEIHVHGADQPEATASEVIRAQRAAAFLGG